MDTSTTNPYQCQSHPTADVFVIRESRINGVNATASCAVCGRLLAERQDAEVYGLRNTIRMVRDALGLPPESPDGGVDLRNKLEELQMESRRNHLMVKMETARAAQTCVISGNKIEQE